MIKRASASPGENEREREREGESALLCSPEIVLYWVGFRTNQVLLQNDQSISQVFKGFGRVHTP